MRAVVLLAALALAAEGQPSSQSVFRSATSAVTVNVSVTNAGRPVEGLTAADFVLSEDGAPQTIRSFSVDAIPVDVTVVLEVTGLQWKSLGTLAGEVRKVASLLRPVDRLRVLTVGTYVREVVPMQDPRSLQLADLDVPNEQSASIYDGLLLAMMRPAEPAHVQLIVAFIRPYDLRSATGAATVLEVARRNDSLLEIIEIGVDEPRRSDWAMETRFRVDDGGQRALTAAAETTGGNFHGLGIGRDKTVPIFQQIFSRFQQSYVLQYSPSNSSPARWHSLHVELRKSNRFVVTARKGYFG